MTFASIHPVRNLISNGASRALFTPLNLSEAKTLTGVGRRSPPALFTPLEI